MHIVHTESSLGWGGQEIRILTEAAGMMRRGHRVTLLCPPQARIYAEALLRGVPALALPIARKNIQGARALYRWVQANPAHVINTHSSTDSWLVALACQFVKNPPPLIRTRHISAVIPDNAATRWLYSRATRHIVTTGEALRQQLINDNGYPAERVTSIPTGVDADLFVPGDKMRARDSAGLPRDKTIIGIVATLRRWKGHRYLIEAFARLPDNNLLLLIVGDGPQHDALKQHIHDAGLDARILMPGNQRDVLPWLQAMDIFVLPSYANEGVPQAIVQAMLVGLPIVTTSVGSIPEAVRDGENGLLVHPQDSTDIVAALDRLLRDAALRLRLGEQGRRFALAHFGLEAMLDKMEAVFRKVCPAP